MTEPTKKMLSIWFFVSIVLGAFGIIVLAVGTMNLVCPPENPAYKLAHLNADFWWGIVMIVFAGLMFVADRIAARRQ
jgi:hypothetical protein